MSGTKSTIGYKIIIFVFYLLVYLAITTRNTYLEYLIISLVWLCLIGNLKNLSKSGLDYYIESGVPSVFTRVLMSIINIIVLTVFIVYGWLWTSCAWFLFTLIMIVTYLRVGLAK